MRFFLILTMLLLGLSACGGSSSSANREARALNQKAQSGALRNAQDVSISGNTFSVAVVREGSYSTVRMNDGSNTVRKNNQIFALVKFVDPLGGAYTSGQVTSAANAVSNCRGTFSGGLIGTPNNSVNLAVIEAKISSKFNGWRVNLTC